LLKAAITANFSFLKINKKRWKKKEKRKQCQSHSAGLKINHNQSSNLVHLCLTKRAEPSKGASS
jgi:hypothetical protein